jgi:hypothetical protein
MHRVIDKRFRQWLRAAKSARMSKALVLLLESCPSPIPAEG